MIDPIMKYLALTRAKSGFRRLSVNSAGVSVTEDVSVRKVWNVLPVRYVLSFHSLTIKGKLSPCRNSADYRDYRSPRLIT